MWCDFGYSLASERIAGSNHWRPGQQARAAVKFYATEIFSCEGEPGWCELAATAVGREGRHRGTHYQCTKMLLREARVCRVFEAAGQGRGRVDAGN